MISILNEIIKIRQNDNLNIDVCNQNRYRVVLKEKETEKTSYYFSTPIYNEKTKKLIRPRFNRQGNEAILIGSNSTITVGREICMTNKNGTCRIGMENELTQISENELRWGEDEIIPTTNGFVYRARMQNRSCISFNLLLGSSCASVRANNRCFSLMRDRFVPFITVSCIGSGQGASLNVSCAAILHYMKTSDLEYTITVRPEAPSAEWVLFEVNLYEPKLIQDTTVETRSPRMNNAFGGVAFIGESELYGEQWLYTKMDFHKLSDLIGKRIHRCLLHFPKLNTSEFQLSAFGVASRFCSFGSTWDNKIPAVRDYTDSIVRDGYQTLDVTKFLINERNGALIHSDGIVIKPKVKNHNFVAIATGDSFYYPQILEINYDDT